MNWNYLGILTRVIHTIHMEKKIQKISDATFTKQKSWEMANKVEIDAKNQNASSAFCINAYFVIFRKYVNTFFIATFFLRLR